MQARLLEKPSVPNGAGDILPLSPSSITDGPDGPANRELVKLKDMLTQRDKEISILYSELWDVVVRVQLYGTKNILCKLEV